MKLTIAVFLFKSLQFIMEQLHWLLEGEDSEDREVILSLLKRYFPLESCTLITYENLGVLLVEDWFQGSAKQLAGPSLGCSSALEVRSSHTWVPSLVVSSRSLSVFCVILGSG
uniref:Uncharacterized protein n=1 Tax=Sus scrofa TaxID=9823 RepID=A0A8D1A7L8_PIG